MPTDTTQSAPATVPPLTIDEHEAATALGLSVHTLRKDRQHDRRIPFYKIGSAVRYDLTRVREALAALEVGGPPKSRRRVTAPA